jgi:hypothetical protein
LAVVAASAAIVGLAGGYLLGQRGPQPVPQSAVAMEAAAEVQASAPHDPDLPNAIAALATAKGGEPVVPRQGATQLLLAVVSFRSASSAAEARQCAETALVSAQARLAGTATPGEADVAVCPSAGEATLEGRLRLSSRPVTAGVGKAPPAQGGCDATLRWQRKDGVAQELRASGEGDSVSVACDQAGRGVIDALVGALGAAASAPSAIPPS